MPVIHDVLATPDAVSSQFIQFYSKDILEILDDFLQKKEHADQILFSRFSNLINQEKETLKQWLVQQYQLYFDFNKNIAEVYNLIPINELNKIETALNNNATDITATLASCHDEDKAFMNQWFVKNKFYFLYETQHKIKSLSPEEMVIIGLAYITGIGVEQDRIKAQNCFEIAAEKNNVLALILLADIYLDGIDGVINTEKSLDYYDRAIQQGSSFAANWRNLRYLKQGTDGSIKMDGRVFQIDDAMAVEDEFQLFLQGYLCIEAKNWEKALIYFDKAAVLGNIEAMLKSGLIYERLGNLNNNSEQTQKAFQRFFLAAERGHVTSAFRLARLYYEYQTNNNDLIEAAKYFSYALQKEPTLDSDSLNDLYEHHSKNPIICFYTALGLNAKHQTQLRPHNTDVFYRLVKYIKKTPESLEKVVTESNINWKILKQMFPARKSKTQNEWQSMLGYDTTRTDLENTLLAVNRLLLQFQLPDQIRNLILKFILPGEQIRKAIIEKEATQKEKIDALSKEIISTKSPDSKKGWLREIHFSKENKKFSKEVPLDVFRQWKVIKDAKQGKISYTEAMRTIKDKREYWKKEQAVWPCKPEELGRKW